MPLTGHDPQLLQNARGIIARYHAPDEEISLQQRIEQAVDHVPANQWQRASERADAFWKASDDWVEAVLDELQAPMGTDGASMVEYAESQMLKKLDGLRACVGDDALPDDFHMRSAFTRLTRQIADAANHSQGARPSPLVSETQPSGKQSLQDMFGPYFRKDEGTGR